MESISFRPPPSLFGVPNAAQLATNLDVRAHHAPPPPAAPTTQANAVGVRSSVEDPPRAAPSWMAFRRPRWRLWPRKDDVGVEVEEEREDGGGGRRGSWVAKILHVGSIWGRRRGAEDGGGGDEGIRAGVEEGDRCVGCCQVEAEEEVVFDQGSFSRLLRRVSLPEASRYSRLSVLGLFAYSVPKIKRGNLLGSHGLRFITSSLEKRATPSDISSEEQAVIREEKVRLESEDEKNGVTSSVAYEIVASAASYVQSRAKNILSFGNSKGDSRRDSGSTSKNIGAILSCDESSFVATTSTVTAVVAAEEELKEAVAKDLNSPQSLPCEWFICDDDSSKTRYFVIQGSESLASWQANLLFEPIQFEGLDFVVHRGIYEAAKGIYEQMLPEVRAHLESNGKSATLQFTGHSLGGSLSLLINLMLLIRGEAPASSLLPVVTFGAPTILCGGNLLLQKLGLPLNHVQAVMMHRDIVPRAFSCNYPDHVAEILKAVNKNFRNHPCLLNKKLLYEPMGELLILQPDEKSSPHHHLLPSGSGLWAFSSPSASRRLIQAAQSFFLNSPHPLEILSDRAAYGSNGTVTRDHDMIAYVRSVKNIIKIEVMRMHKVEIGRRRRMWAALVILGEMETKVGQHEPASHASSPPQLARFAGVFRGGLEPLKRLGRLVASQHMHLLVVMLLPARVLIMKALAVVSLS